MTAAGDWNIAIPALGVKLYLKLASPSAGVLTGTIVEIKNPPPHPVEIQHGRENAMHFSFDTPAAGVAPAASFDGTVSGTSMSGKVSGLDFNGTRV